MMQRECAKVTTRHLGLCQNSIPNKRSKMSCKENKESRNFQPILDRIAVLFKLRTQKSAHVRTHDAPFLQLTVGVARMVCKACNRSHPLGIHHQPSSQTGEIKIVLFCIIFTILCSTSEHIHSILVDVESQNSEMPNRRKYMQHIATSITSHTPHAIVTLSSGDDFSSVFNQNCS